MSVVDDGSQHMTLYFEEIPAGSSPTPEDGDDPVTFDDDSKVNPCQWSTEDGDPVLIPVELDDAAHFADKENIASQQQHQQQQKPPQPQQQASSAVSTPSVLMTSAWERVAASLPDARGGHTLVTIDEERILLFGGSNRAAHFFDDVHIYNPHTCRWSQPKVRGKTPPARCGHSAVYYDGCVYIYGGQQVTALADTDAAAGGCGYEMSFFGDIWQLDCRRSSTLRWTKLVVGGADRMQPQPRNGHTATLIGCNMFVVGGSNEHGPQADVHCFALDTLTWHRVDAKSIGGDGPPPASREGHCAWAVHTGANGGGDQDSATAIVIAGGRGVEGLYGDCFVLLLTPKSTHKGLWCYLGQGPAVCNAAGFMVGDALGVYGGVGDNSTPNGDAFVFTPPSHDYWLSALKSTHQLMTDDDHWQKVALSSPPSSSSSSSSSSSLRSSSPLPTSNVVDDDDAQRSSTSQAPSCARFAHAMSRCVSPSSSQHHEFVMMGGMSTHEDLTDVYHVSFCTCTTSDTDNNISSSSSSSSSSKNMSKIST